MSTAIDTALAHAAIYCTVPENYRSGATVTLNVNFILPVKKGSRVTIESKKTGGGRTMFMSVAAARDVHEIAHQDNWIDTQRRVLNSLRHSHASPA